MRGAQAQRPQRLVRLRIIPAYAGSTNVNRHRIRLNRDHPCVCGEHPSMLYLVTPCQGSSPRMRGARRRVARLVGRPGIIPAYAGSTRPRGSCRSSRWDHPRVCGEHGHLVRDNFRIEGSSPRMRGAQQARVPEVAAEGIIPAYAGSTFSTALPKTIRWDHPRVCGEHSLAVSPEMKVEGSSPRMRGAHGNHPERHTGTGIIPAYAGSTHRHHH